MQTLQHPISQSIPARTIQARSSFSFLGWCAKQEENHFLWMAFILAVQACVLIPITLLSILVNGNNETALIILLSVTAISITSLLAAMSTKYTIPIFVVALLADIAVTAASWFHVFN